ncbi:MAG: hypothetical protein U9P14_00615 [Gemmatimonadota bacterium]|nr:hypothetical protein [Gemmatimonadota bacterium]
MKQLTCSPLIHQHIYPEAPIFTPDSRFFVYSRRQSPDQPRSYWLCEVGEKWRLYRMTDESPVAGPVISPDGEYLYYLWERTENEVVLVRRHLWNGLREELIVVRGFHGIYPLGTMSPDGRYYATRMLQADMTACILRFDIAELSWRIIHCHPEIFNAHLQWEPGRGQDILIQHNRGGRLDAYGNSAPRCGPEGATLYLIDFEGKNKRPLSIGKPHTPRVQGHHVWLGHTGTILSTLGRDVEIDGKKGNLVTVAEGDKAPRVVSTGRFFYHVAASADGKYFICDDDPDDIYVGSVKTGKYRLLCRSETTLGAGQYTEAHAFLSPDCRYAFFNSTRSGIAQIYAATVPEGFLESLEN